MHGAGGRARDGRRPRRGDVDGDVRPGFSISRLSRRGVHVGGGAGPAEAWADGSGGEMDVDVAVK